MRSRTILAGGLALLALGTLVPAARADVVQLQASKDNSIYSEGGLSNGAGEYLFAGKTNLGDIRRAIVRFDVAGSIPSGATINSASLRLVSNTPGFTGSRTISLRPATADWGEGASNASGEEGAGAPAQTDDATWGFRFFNTLSWSSAGGTFGAVSASFIVNAPNTHNISSAQMATDVQNWLDTPASNFGWFLIGDEGAVHTAKRFASKDYLASAADRPVLTVDYTATEVPGLPAWGPLALLTLLAGAAFPFLRRRTAIA